MQQKEMSPIENGLLKLLILHFFILFVPHIRETEVYHLNSPFYFHNGRKVLNKLQIYAKLIKIYAICILTVSF
jgi:hypothetical protein